MDKFAVLYHAGCPDGFTAAWAAWKSLGDDAKYIPASYGDLIKEPDSLVVYLLDFSLPRNILERWLHNRSVVVLDHHKTAEEELGDFSGAILDMNKSGAMLAWGYFHPLTVAPDLVQYVQDRDLWRWSLPHSREVSAAVSSYPFTFQVWDQIASTPLDRLMVDGEAILRYQQRLVAMMADRAGMWTIQGHRVPVVNASVLSSEVGEELCRRHPEAPFSAYYFDRESNTRQWGLRSPGRLDVSEVAKRLGGGGHPGAAGFLTRAR